MSEAPAFHDGEACTLSEEPRPLFPAMVRGLGPQSEGGGESRKMEIL